MRSVSIARFKDSLSEIVAAAEAGEEVVITRHGKPAVRLMAVEADSRLGWEADVQAAQEFGRRVLRENGPTTRAEISAWIREDRRWED